MSVKFEVNFESLFERLVDYTVIDDIKAITFHNYTLHEIVLVLPYKQRAIIL